MDRIQSPIGSYPSDWNLAILNSVAELKHGYQFRTTDFTKEGIKVFKITQIKSNGVIDISSCDYIDKSRLEDFNRVIIQKGDILMALTGATIGKIARYNSDEMVLQNYRVGNFLPLDEKVLSKDYFYYFLTSNYTYQQILANETQSAQQNVGKDDIHKMFLFLPPFDEQVAIAEVLKSLDDKIDLLHRQNIKLEKLAEILFRQWFVEEATDEWKVEKLGDIAEVQNGYAFSSRDYVAFQEGHLEVLKMGHIEKGGGLRSSPKTDFVPRSEKLNRWILNKGDIIMAMTDMKDNVVILGVPAMIDRDNKYVLNQRVARLHLKTKEKLINNYLLYIQLKDSDFIATLQSKANSGVQVNLSTETIKDCDIILPPMKLQKEIGNTITDLYLKKELNDNNIKTLTTLRDSLLPKLISGEVRVEFK
jgi:type I restriction enzyme S subunit